MRQKFLSVQGETAILDWFSMYEGVFDYGKSILACTENTLEEYKFLRRIRQEYFAVHILYVHRD